MSGRRVLQSFGFVGVSENPPHGSLFAAQAVMQELEQTRARQEACESLGALRNTNAKELKE